MAPPPPSRWRWSCSSCRVLLIRTPAAAVFLLSSGSGARTGEGLSPGGGELGVVPLGVDGNRWAPLNDAELGRLSPSLQPVEELPGRTVSDRGSAPATSFSPGDREDQDVPLLLERRGLLPTAYPSSTRPPTSLQQIRQRGSAAGSAGARRYPPGSAAALMGSSTGGTVSGPDDANNQPDANSTAPTGTDLAIAAPGATWINFSTLPGSDVHATTAFAGAASNVIDGDKDPLFWKDPAQVGFLVGRILWWRWDSSGRVGKYPLPHDRSNCICSSSTQCVGGEKYDERIKKKMIPCPHFQ